MKHLLLTLTLLIFVNCATQITTEPSFISNNYKYTISSREDPFLASDLDIKSKFKYAFIYNSSVDPLIDPLLEKQVLFIVHTSLSKLGWTMVDDLSNAEYVIQATFNIEEVTRTGSKQIKTGKTVDTKWWDGTAKTDYDGNVKYKDTYDTKYYDYNAYLRNFNIRFFDSNAAVVWSTDITSEGSGSDILKVAKGVLPSAMAKFPSIVSGEFRAGVYKGCMEINANNYCNYCDLPDSSKCTYGE